jgi:hypothetical protein
MRIQMQQVIKVTALLVVASLILQGAPVWAGFNPRNREARRPGNRQPGGTRPDCGTDLKPPLTALVPQSKQGLSQELTVSAYPTFHWYMPQNNNHPVAQFVLYKVTRLEPVIEEVEVFSTKFQIPQRAGVASLKLPVEAMVPALAVGQDYRWQIQLLCLDQDEEYVVNQFVEGWITRVQPSTDLTRRLNHAAPADRIDIFAEAGLWYDALTQLTTLHRSKPQDQRLKQEWQTLFNSEYVRLSDIPPLSRSQ